MIAYAFMNWSYSIEEVRRWYAGKFHEWDWGLIVEHSGTHVGFVAVTGSHLDQLFVDPRYQRRGIGTSLLKAACSRTQPITTLNVFEQNIPARRFYERHGFQKVRRFFNERERCFELVYGSDGLPEGSNRAT